MSSLVVIGFRWWVVVGLPFLTVGKQPVEPSMRIDLLHIRAEMETGWVVLLLNKNACVWQSKIPAEVLGQLSDDMPRSPKACLATLAQQLVMHESLLMLVL
ncbi:hypothetical protein D9M71_817030 [compost metagenome]